MPNPLTPDSPKVPAPSVLVVEPVFGLGNRMGFIDSAVSLAESTGMRLVVLWFLDQTLNCRFDDLFIPPQGIHRIFQFRLGTATRVVRKLIRVFFSRTARVFADPKSLQEYHEQNWDFRQLQRTSMNYLWGYCEFFPVAQPYRIFRPAPVLKDVIDSFPIDEHTVGIHIRRGDSKLSILYSATESFIRVMHREVYNNPDVKFFLATDMPKDEATIRSLFPGRVLSYPKRSLDRNSPAANRDAVVDLYCLSRCRKIIGSYYSSFSRVAWMIRGIEHEIINDTDNEQMDSDAS